jgi:succinate-semialdehyde dehydrogenase/glutarate-semialdehyde dehydrogenase
MNLQNPQLLQSSNLIDGQWVRADSGETLSVLNPANGQLLAEVPRCGAAETRRAIAAAERSWPAWRALTAKQRGALLDAWFKLIIENVDDLAQLITAECGKPLAEAKGVPRRLFRVVCRGRDLRREHPQPGGRPVVIKQPIMCVPQSPRGISLAMITRKVAPALLPVQ